MGVITLGTFLRGCCGQRVVVELKDETAIEGTIACADPCSLNIQLADAVLYTRREKGAKPTNLETFFVKGKYIRFVHFDSYPNVLHLLKQSLRKL